MDAPSLFTTVVVMAPTKIILYLLLELVPWRLSRKITFARIFFPSSWFIFHLNEKCLHSWIENNDLAAASYQVCNIIFLDVYACLQSRRWLGGHYNSLWAFSVAKIIHLDEKLHLLFFYGSTYEFFYGSPRHKGSRSWFVPQSNHEKNLGEKNVSLHFLQNLWVIKQKGVRRK